MCVGKSKIFHTLRSFSPPLDCRCNFFAFLESSRRALQHINFFVCLPCFLFAEGSCASRAADFLIFFLSLCISFILLDTFATFASFSNFW